MAYGVEYINISYLPDLCNVLYLYIVYHDALNGAMWNHDTIDT